MSLPIALRRPKLRFPEFRDAGEWKSGQLGTMCDSISSGKDKSDPDGECDLYGSTGIIGKTSSDSYNGEYLLVARVGANAGLLTRANGKFGVTDNTLVISLSKKDNIDFIFYYLVNMCLNKLVFGSGQPLITGGQLKALSLLLPQQPEQKKIADCLASLDELITLEAQKLDTLKTHKKGLMQQLFPAEGETLPKLRFPEFRDAKEWDADELGEVAEFVNEKIPLEQIALEKYISTENIFPDYGGVVRASKLPAMGSVTRFKPNDTLVSNIRPYLKKVWVADKEGGASNDVIVIRAKQRFLPQYFSFLLKNDAFIDYMMIGAKGVKMPRGDVGSMKKYPALYPSKTEQQKIADCLSSLDELITAQTQKLEMLKAHKKGLMQQLFPTLDEAQG